MRHFELLPYVAPCAGAIAIGISITLLCRSIKSPKAENTIEGSVSNIHPDPNRRDGELTVIAVVEYTDRNGKKQKYFWKTHNSLSLGQSVKLVFFETNPNTVEIAEKSENIILHVMGIVGGILFVLMGFLL